MVYIMNIRINVNIPAALFQKMDNLVKNGYFSNLSEIVREGLREEVKRYEYNIPLLSDDEKNLFALLKEAEQSGQLLDEEEMRKHGLSL